MFTVRRPVGDDVSNSKREDAKTDVFGVEFANDAHQVGNAPGKAIKLGDDEDIAVASKQYCLTKSRARADSAGALAEQLPDADCS